MRSNTKFSNGGDVTNLQVWYLNNYITIWTFFRVKLVFECNFEISWSLGPLDLWTLGPWDYWTLGPLPSSTTSTYFLLTLFTSIYILLLFTFKLLLSTVTSWFDIVWYGLIWGGGGGCSQMTIVFFELWWRLRLEMDKDLSLTIDY